MHKIIVLSGQHVGEEIIPYASLLLQLMIEKHALPFELFPLNGTLTTPEVLEHAKTAAAILTGPLTLEEKSIVETQLGVTTQLHPVICYPTLVEQSPLRQENLEHGFDLLLAFPVGDGLAATCSLGNQLAQERRGALLSTIGPPFVENNVRHMSAGQIATQLLFNQSQFDVIVTTAESGETLTMLAQELTGTPQLYATGWIGEVAPCVFEATALMQKIHAGKNTANPVCGFLAVSGLLRHGFHLPALADDIEDAIKAVFSVGARTTDLAPTDPFVATTDEMAHMILQAL